MPLGANCSSTRNKSKMSLFAPLPHNSPATAPPALSFLPSTPSNIITNSALKDGPPRKRQRSDDGPTPASSASQVSSTNAPALADVRRSPAPDPDNSPSMDDLQHREGRRGSIILEGQVESVKRDVAPFLSKHIPGQYNPQSATTPTKPHNAVTPSSPSQNNNSYCYRHRPDVKCRRQAADERAMEELQKVRRFPLSLHSAGNLCPVWRSSITYFPSRT